MITLNSWGFRSFSVRLNESEVDYVVMYNKHDLPRGIYKKNLPETQLSYEVSEKVLSSVISKTLAGHTVRSLIKLWVAAAVSPIEGGTSTFSIVFYDGGE